MPRYRVLYLKDELSRRFRELPPASIPKQLKPKDYLPVAEIEATNEYAAWQVLKAGGPAEPSGQKPSGRPFGVGDVLERDGGKPLLCLFGGFEEAAWWTPEAAAPTQQEGDAPVGGS